MTLCSLSSLCVGVQTANKPGMLLVCECLVSGVWSLVRVSGGWCLFVSLWCECLVSVCERLVGVSNTVTSMSKEAYSHLVTMRIINFKDEKVWVGRTSMFKEACEHGATIRIM